MNTKRLITAILASGLLISPSFTQDRAMDNSSKTALAPGKPAGVHQADLSSPTLIGLGFLAVIGVGIGLVVGNEGNQKGTPNSPAATGTTGT